MKAFLHRYRHAFIFNAFVIPTSFVLMGWKWGFVNVFAALLGSAIGISTHKKEIS